MKLLIVTICGDVHAAAIKWGVQKLGCEVHTLRFDNFPRTLSSSWRLSNDLDEIQYETVGVLNGYDTILVRRIGDPQLGHLHPSDHRFADVESRDYLTSLLHRVRSNAFEVNSIAVSRVAALKHIQLSAARTVGLRIPETLISNDPSEVRRFYDTFSGKIIQKTSRPHQWVTSDGKRYVNAITTAVSERSALTDLGVAACPAIYQECLEKTREFRITFIGERAFVAMVHPTRPNMVDWRSPNPVLSDGSSSISDDLLERCRQLMRKLGLVFGCFDFVQNKEDDDPIFLEVNPMGQWLYIERLLPQFRMLECFCHLLQTRDPVACRDFEGNGDISWRAFRNTDNYVKFRPEIIDRLRTQSSSFKTMEVEL